MDELIACQSRRIIRPNGSQAIGEGPLLREHTLRITVNEEPLFHLVCTGEHLEELTLGRLLTEGLIRGREDVASVRREEGEVRVLLRESLPRKRPPLERLPEHRWEPAWIFRLTEVFSRGTRLHALTQGTHVCLLARGDRLLFSCEDMGRHNAVDKAVGHALLQGEDRSACILFLSGRAPADMVEKVISAGIPVLATKSVPTAQSVALARAYGLTLICRAHPDQIEVY